MMKAITTAATGLEAQQANIERISNDLANANTDAYKRSRIEFQDLMYETLKEPGMPLGEGSQTPVGVQRGLGVKVGATHKIMEQGNPKMTYRPYDIMIQGKGFLPVQTPDGEVAYTRNGQFKKDSNGQLVLTSGAQIIPNITIPIEATNFLVSPRGEVNAVMPNGEAVQLGQIQVVGFQNPEGLKAIGNSLYKPTLGSGNPNQAVPGENGLGELLQGAVEGSNVNVADSMVNMISAQRTYEMGTKVMKTADQMLEATVNLK